MSLARVLLPRPLRRLHRIARSWWLGGPACGVCGFAGSWEHRPTLWPGLVAEWELDADWARWMDQREGTRCVRCGANQRSSQMAHAITAWLRARGAVASALASACATPQARSLAIAEINSAGNLHRHLARCPGLRFSSFGSRDPAVPSEDLMQLSYPDRSLDLALTSDTLEHVPDVDRALRETFRILRPGGAHILSVPIVEGRPTRQRAALRDGRLEHLLPPSYHGLPEQGKGDFLVFYEFGPDFLDRVHAVGFAVDVLRDPDNPAVTTLVAHRRS